MPESDSPSLQSVLREEYALIQAKIDHVGEFKFRVRGWSLTLQTAMWGALFTGKTAIPVTYLGLATLLFTMLGVVFLFHFLEQEQESISRALRQRAGYLEKTLDQLTVTRGWPEERKRLSLQHSLDEIESTPRIAATMRNAARAGFLANVRSMRRANVYAFYMMQYALTLIVGTLIFVSQPVEGARFNRLKPESAKPAAVKSADYAGPQ